jgi:hypothetical protein
MYDKKELCEKIIAMYPEIGACGLNLDVNFDDEKNAWAVRLNKDNHTLTHYLDGPEADHCMNGRECVSLGLEIAQLKKNIEGQQF